MYIAATQLASFGRLPAWQVMWLLAAGVFAAGKCLSLGHAGAGNGARALRVAGYLFAWPGLDARTFLSQGTPRTKSASDDWGRAARNIVAGALLLWGVCRPLPKTQSLLIGWVGMLGLILLLHFGLFQLLALGWQKHGVDAAPLMNRPMSATSLSDFWGRRWNTAFSDFAHRLIFRPLARRFDARIALLIAFTFSGLIHDLVISVPARGGYGLPTAYFTLQGAGILLERSLIGRGLGLSQGLRWRLYIAIVAGAPAFWLFHPPFVTRVIVPLLHAIGAVGN